MNPKELARIGEALYGRWWRDPLADDLSISYRTMRRWGNGDSAIPDGVRADLAALVKKRGSEIAKILDALEEV